MALQSREDLIMKRLLCEGAQLFGIYGVLA